MITSGTIEAPNSELLAVGWPPWLVKATFDPFVYAVGLRNGLTLTFNEAEQMQGSSEWVRLLGVAQFTLPSSNTVGLEEAPFVVGAGPYTFARGLEVRLADIVWVADAPFGS